MRGTSPPARRPMVRARKSWSMTPGDRDGQTGGGREERGERPAGQNRRQDGAEEARSDHGGQQQRHGVRAGAVGQGREVDATEHAVDRCEQVEEPEQGDHDERGATGRAAVGVGVEADQHVRQPHGAEAEGKDRRVRGVDGMLAATEAAERLRPVGTASGGHVRAGRSALPPQGEQDEGRDRDRGELQPVLHGLHEGDRPHPARRHVGQHDHGHDETAERGRRAGDGAQGDPGALELREQVEPADADDEQRRQRAHVARLQAGLGEVGERVGARSPQRSGDEDQEHDVADGVADGEPEHVGAERVDEAGDAEERRGGEVLAADRRGVPAGADAAAGDVEVARGPGQPQPESTRHEGDAADDGDGEHAGLGDAHRCLIRSENSRSIRSAWYT